MRVVHFLLHVPKCAGTTVERHFQKHLGDRFMYAPRWKDPLRNFVGNRYPMLVAADLSSIQVVSGHSLSSGLREKFPGAEIRESVILRDPMGWLLSLYNYRIARSQDGYGSAPPGFELWYSAQRRNPISRFLINRYFEQGVPAIYGMSSSERLTFLEQRLAGFHFVGGIKRADEMISGISEELGVPADITRHVVTEKPRITEQDIPARLRDRIRRDNALDQHLFDRWADRGWSQGAIAPVPTLSRFDHGRYLLEDTRSVLLRKLLS